MIEVSDPTHSKRGAERKMDLLPPEACSEYSLAVLLVSWKIFSTSNFIAVFLPGGGGHLMKEQLHHFKHTTTQLNPQP